MMRAVRQILKIEMTFNPQFQQGLTHHEADGLSRYFELRAGRLGLCADDGCTGERSARRSGLPSWRCHWRFAAWAKISGGRTLRAVADGYTTIIRGIPDLLVIYLFYFGGSAAVTALGKYFGAEGFIGFPGFLAGVLAIAISCGRTTRKYSVVHSGPCPKANSKLLLLAAWARC